MIEGGTGQSNAGDHPSLGAITTHGPFMPHSPRLDPGIPKKIGLVVEYHEKDLAEALPIEVQLIEEPGGLAPPIS